MNIKTILTIGILGALLTLTGCNYFTIDTKSTEATTSPAEIPNPASVYCKENSGTLEMRQASDGSVAGFCLFSDGSECDEWAYFRGECKAGDSLKPTEVSVTPGNSLEPGTEAVSDWWGVIKKAGLGGQFDDYFERQDLGQVISYGIDSLDPAMQSQIEALRDSGKIVHLYGIMLTDVPDYNGTQIQPDRIVVEE